jgi:hypothetical protein
MKRKFQLAAAALATLTAAGVLCFSVPSANADSTTGQCVEGCETKFRLCQTQREPGKPGEPSCVSEFLDCIYDCGLP